jgi:hypothetical protein
MQNIFFVSLALCLLSGSLSAQSSSAAGPCPASTKSRAGKDQAGAMLVASLTKRLDTKKVRVGEAVSAITMNDILSSFVSVPAGSTLSGKVTCSTASAHGAATSALALEFDHARLKDGSLVRLQATLQAVITPPPYGSTGVGPEDGGMTFQGALRVPGGLSGTSGSIVGGTAPHGGSSAPAPDVKFTQMSTGVIGIKNVEMTSTPASENPSVLTSKGKSVKLEAGTRLLLKVTEMVPNSPSQ